MTCICSCFLTGVGTSVPYNPLWQCHLANRCCCQTPLGVFKRPSPYCKWGFYSIIVNSNNIESCYLQWFTSDASSSCTASSYTLQKILPCERRCRRYSNITEDAMVVAPENSMAAVNPACSLMRPEMGVPNIPPSVIEKNARLTPCWIF